MTHKLPTRLSDGAPLEATNWRLEMVAAAPTFVAVAADTDEPERAERAMAPGVDAGGARKGSRRAYIPEAGGFIACPVIARYRLVAGDEVTGPALVEERETTTLLLPGDRAGVDAYANLIVDVGTAGR